MSQEPNALNDDELKDVAGGWRITPPMLNATRSAHVEGLNNKTSAALGSMLIGENGVPSVSGDDDTDPRSETEEWW